MTTYAPPSAAPPPRRAQPIQAAAFGGPGPIRARLVYGPCDGAELQARAEADGRPPAGLQITRLDIPPLSLDSFADDAESPSPFPCIEIPLPSYHDYDLLRDGQGNPAFHRTTWLYVWRGYVGPVYYP